MHIYVDILFTGVRASKHISILEFLVVFVALRFIIMVSLFLKLPIGKK